MHTTDVGTANVPAFLTKLWKLVEDPVYNDLISWAPNGRSFVIKNQSRFSKELLPLYFKHNNMASFIRQLNMYGFRKLTSIENSGLKADKDDMEFYHQYFLKGQESLLEYIKRKVAAPVKGLNGDDNHFKNDDVKEILTDVRAIRDRQETTDSCLVNMQRENAALWKEIAVLRQKHQKQQQIVERLIQFLVTLVQNQQQNVHAMKRKTPLMIEGETESTSAKRLHSTKDHEAIQGGPVIHDVTNDFIDTELEAAANSNPVISLHQDNDESIDLLCMPDLKSIPVVTGTNIAAPRVQPSPTNGIVVIPTNSGETLTVDDLTTDTSGNNIISNVTDGTNSNNGIVMVPTGSGETPYSTENLTTDPSGNNNSNITTNSVSNAVSNAVANAVAAAAAAAANSNAAAAVAAAANAVASGDNSSNDGVIMIPTNSANSGFTREFLSDQVESVDIELNWLQEQLQHGGLSFDPTVSDPNLSSLIEGDW